MSTISPLIDQSSVRPWIVCESGQRWVTASRRFSTQLLPPNFTANVLACGPVDIPMQLVRQPSAIVLWEISPANTIGILDHITALSWSHPHVLQIAAASEITDGDLISLSEMGIKAIVTETEQLPGLRKMIYRYLTRC